MPTLITNPGNFLFSGAIFNPARFPDPVAVFDASVVSSLFQDTSGTTPVAAATDPVGRINNILPGATDYLGQGTAGNRPLWNTYLATPRSGLIFDGTNDRLVSSLAAGSWKFLHTSGGCTVYLRFYITDNSPTNKQTLFDTSNDSTSNVGHIATFRGDGGTLNTIESTWFRAAGGTTCASGRSTTGTVPSNQTDNILSISFERVSTTNIIIVRRNGTEILNTTGSNAPSAADPSGALRVGTTVGEDGQFLKGGLLRAYFYSSAHSVAIKQKIEAGIAL